MFDIETDAALSVFALSEIILAGISRLAVCETSETSHEDLGLYPGLGRGGQLWWNSTYIKDHLCLDIPGVVWCFNIHRSSIVDSNGLVSRVKTQAGEEVVRPYSGLCHTSDR